MKKIQKTIKLNYILNTAIKEYSAKNSLTEIDVIEKALDDFFREKENNRIHYEILELTQMMIDKVNNQEKYLKVIHSQTTDLKKDIARFE